MLMPFTVNLDFLGVFRFAQRQCFVRRAKYGQSIDFLVVFGCLQGVSKWLTPLDK